jgi:hypothetical protein
MDAAAWITLACSLIALAGGLLWLRGRSNMTHRDQFPRLYELRDLLPDPAPENSFFRNLEPTLAEIRMKRAAYQILEADLDSLDPASWAFLKAEMVPLLTVHLGPRGWQPLIDKLNEAKAYHYLKDLGLTEIGFIPRARRRGQRTPDLSARSGTTKVLCETKTINISKREADRRAEGGVGSTETELDDGFFLKLRQDLLDAQAQMQAFDNDASVLRIAFVIVNYDDFLGEAADLYEAQINTFLKHQSPTPDLKIVFKINRVL